MLRSLRRPPRAFAGLITAVVWLMSVAQRPVSAGSERPELEQRAPVFAPAVAATAHLLRLCDEGCARHPSQHPVAADSPRSSEPKAIALARITAAPRDAREHGTWHRTAPHDATAPPESR